MRFFLLSPIEWLLLGSSTEHDTKWRVCMHFNNSTFLKNFVACCYAMLTPFQTCSWFVYVTSQRPCWWSSTKAFLFSGTKLYFHVNSLRKNSIILTPTWPLCHVVAKPKNPTWTITIILFQTLERTISKVSVSPVQSC